MLVSVAGLVAAVSAPAAWARDGHPSDRGNRGSDDAAATTVGVQDDDLANTDINDDRGVDMQAAPAAAVAPVDVQRDDSVDTD